MLLLKKTRDDFREHLKKSGIDSPTLEIDVMLQYALGLSRSEILANPNRVVSELEAGVLSGFLNERIGKRKPLSQVVGNAVFFGHTLFVNSDCLTPRPETETLVERVLSDYGNTQICFADWCTGSGCIAISLLLDRPLWSGVAVDTSPLALWIAWKNHVKFKLMDRLLLWHTGFPNYAPLEPESLDLITCNPPYIPDNVMPNLMPEVLYHEPHLALDGGQWGIRYYHLFFRAFSCFLRRSGRIYFETDGENQMKLIEQIAPPSLFLEATFPDLFGKERFMVWRKK